MTADVRDCISSACRPFSAEVLAYEGNFLGSTASRTPVCAMCIVRDIPPELLKPAAPLIWSRWPLPSLIYLEVIFEIAFVNLGPEFRRARTSEHLITFY